MFQAKKTIKNFFININGVPIRETEFVNYMVNIIFI